MDQARDEPNIKREVKTINLMPADMSGAMWLQLEVGIEVRVVTYPFYGLALLGSHRH